MAATGLFEPNGVGISLIDWLVNLPLYVGAAVGVLAAIVSGFAVYFVSRASIRGNLTQDIVGLAGNLFRISGTLLGLLLSLTFADVRAELAKLRDTVELETAQLGDINRDLRRFESDAARRVRDKISEYADTVIRDEWGSLAAERASDRATTLFDEIEMGLLRLQPKSPEQEVLRARLLVDIDEITDLRATRFFRATVAPPAFLYIAVLGFLCTMGMLGVHEATLRSMMLMGFYCAFVGVVIFFILSLSHPFEGIGRVTPEAFQVLRDQTAS